jgi:hypothetical protein
VHSPTRSAGGLRQNVVRDRRAAPICATSLAGVTREVEEEWNQRGKGTPNSLVFEPRNVELLA